MNLAVFGLGYVGCVSATCFAESGHHVVGVDVNPAKVAQINEGRAPIVEPQLAERLKSAVSAGRLKATTDPAVAMKDAEVAFVCVGTPSAENGSLDYTHLRDVAEQLAQCLKFAKPGVVVAIRSTVMADVVLQEVVPRLEQGGGKAGVDFGVCINPEFLREGSAIKDFHGPPFTLIGATDPKSGARLAEVYAGIDAPILQVDLRTAGLVKYASNAYHALKVTFANELGVLCEQVGADSHAVMEVFCRDTKLNVSAAYLKPGFAFGGSCLPKDLRALQHRARHGDADLPVLTSILRSNEIHINRAVDAVMRTGKRKIGMVGLSFKPATDDLRESPLVGVIERLIGRGLDLSIFDSEVTFSRVHGGNRAFIDRTIPHITGLMSDSLDQLIAKSDVVVVGKAVSGLVEALERTPKAGQVIVDLVRGWDRSQETVAGRPVIRIC